MNAFESPRVTERKIESGKFVIGVDCKACGQRHYGRSYISTNQAFIDALAKRDACKCGGGK